MSHVRESPTVPAGKPERRSCAGLFLEREIWDAGFVLVAGVDEVGRGAWAGPLVAAAVVLPNDECVLGRLVGRVDDSKRLAPHVRELLLPEVMSVALGVGIGWVAADELDELGLGAANRLAMARAVVDLPLDPSYLLLDYLRLPASNCPQRAIPHGDGASLSIAAASIVAKVTRDRWMAGQDGLYRGYGFASHKGYGTAQHRRALAAHGPSPLHRCSFEPVARWLAAHR